MKKLFLTFFIGFFILTSILIFNAISIKSKQLPKGDDPVAEIIVGGSVDRLARSITFKTVSYDDTAQIDYTAFLAFHEFLKANFAAVFSNLELEMVGKYTLVLKWAGKNQALPPAIFMSLSHTTPRR